MSALPPPSPPPSASDTPAATSGTPPPPPPPPAGPHSAPKASAPVAITKSEPPTLEPKPSRRRGWLIGWLALGAAAAVAIGYIVLRSNDDTISGAMAEIAVETDPDFDTETGTDVDSDEPVFTDPDPAGDVDDPIDAADTADAPDLAVDDGDGDGDGDGDDEDVSAGDAVVPGAGSDFEPSTSINPPVLVDGDDAGGDGVDAGGDGVDAGGDGGDEVPESRATVRNGQIYFDGAVPTREQADEIVQLAVEILGEDNVFDNYVIDPRAGDPNVGNITVEDTITFGTDSAQVLPEADTLLNQGLALLTVRPAMTVTIVGHTDSRGSDAANERLSLARADAVKAWFVERGVDPARLSTRGAGSSEAVASNDTPEGRQENRRIQFFLENVLGA